VWVSENMTPFADDEDNPEAKELARKCLAEAEEQGISYTELKEAAGGDLVAFLRGRSGGLDEAEPPHSKSEVPQRLQACLGSAGLP
jgi:hypothetical protein